MYVYYVNFNVNAFIHDHYIKHFYYKSFFSTYYHICCCCRSINYVCLLENWNPTFSLIEKRKMFFFLNF